MRVVDIYHYICVTHNIYIYSKDSSLYTTYGAGEDRIKFTCPKRGNLQRSVFEQCCGRQTIVQGQHTSLRETGRDKIIYENTACGRQGRQRLHRTVIIMFSPDRITTPREPRTKPLGNRFFLSVFLILYDDFFFHHRLRRRFVSPPPPPQISYAVVCKVASRIFCVHGTLENRRNILKIIIIINNILR